MVRGEAPSRLTSSCPSVSPSPSVSALVGSVVVEGSKSGVNETGPPKESGPALVSPISLPSCSPSPSVSTVERICSESRFIDIQNAVVVIVGVDGVDLAILIVVTSVDLWRHRDAGFLYRSRAILIGHRIVKDNITGVVAVGEVGKGAVGVEHDLAERRLCQQLEDQIIVIRHRDRSRCHRRYR